MAMDLQKVLLGALFLKPELVPHALPGLELEHFRTELQPVFAGISGFWEAKGRVDVMEIAARYPEYKELIFGCVAECENECVRITRENVEAWAGAIIRQHALQRFQSLALQAASGATAYEDLNGLYSRMGEALCLEKEDRDFAPIGELVQRYVSRMDQPNTYLPTGIPKLDESLHLSPGNFLIIGGRPSAGKTALSLQMACQMAKQGVRVCYFSLETDPDTLTARIIANHLCQPLAAVRDKCLPPDTLDDLSGLLKLPLYIRSAAGKSVAWMKAQAQRMKAQAVFVDYVQIIRDGPADKSDRYQQITRVSIALHEMAQTTGMVVVALAQLNRAAAHAAPSAADLKESGQLEQDADAILLLSASDVRYTCILAKNKEGRVGRVPLTFDRERQRFG